MRKANMMTDNGLVIWTVYKSPADYPGKFVARLWLNDQPAGSIVVELDLYTLRESLPPGLYWMPRQEGDDPVIVETWF